MTTYLESGVNIDAGNELVQRIKSIAKPTFRPEVISPIGGFSSLFKLKRYNNPILVSSTDGVGSKLNLAIKHKAYHGIGQDLVAMCVNDIIVHGAEPLFILDYLSTDRLDVDEASKILVGVAQGCMACGAALIGGETAELPGTYWDHHYDLAGFVVGMVEERNLIDGKNMQEGDVLLGLASSGPHANGFSLINKLIKSKRIDVNKELWGYPIISHLLTPTINYTTSLLEVADKFPLQGAAHITGGGLAENLARIIPDGFIAEIHMDTWRWPPIFQWIKEEGEVPITDMRRTFNCGIGMVLVVPDECSEEVTDLLQSMGETVYRIGLITT